MSIWDIIWNKLGINIQIAGKGANQGQTVITTVHHGISEQRGREIVTELCATAINEWAIEAHATIKLRVNELEKKLMNRISQVETTLEIFKDPGFQLFLQDAQRSAATAERDSDLDVIADMLFRRFTNTPEQDSHVLLSRAIEVISQISNGSLLAITVLFSLFIRSSIAISDKNLPCNFFDEIDCYDRFYEQLLTNTISQCKLALNEYDWVWELELLDLIRFDSRTDDPLYKYEDSLFDDYSGVIAIGLQKGSEEHIHAENLLRKICWNKIVLVEHELNNGYVRLGINSLDQISEMNLSADQLEYVQNIILSYVEDEGLLKVNKQLFIDEWNKRTHLSFATQFWNDFYSYYSFEITPLGMMISMSFLKAKGMR